MGLEEITVTTVIKMNRNRQINLPSAFVALLNVGDDNYFKAEIRGNHIVLTPIDPIERVFSEADLDLVEAVYRKEKKLSRPVSPEWVKKTHSTP